MLKHGSFNCCSNFLERRNDGICKRFSRFVQEVDRCSAKRNKKRDKLKNVTRITRPCVLYPLTPHFYIEKLECTGYIHFFLILL